MAPATKGGLHFLERSEGGLFSSGEARLSGFSRQRRHKKWRPKGRRTSPAQRCYITPEGESPQPVREASAGPRQTPWRPRPNGPAAPSTLAATPRQPSGIPASTAQVPVPIPTTPQAPTTAALLERSDATFLHNPWHRGPEARWMPSAPLRRRRRPLSAFPLSSPISNLPDGTYHSACRAYSYPPDRC